MSFHHWSISKKILLGMLPLFLVFVALSVAPEREVLRTGLPKFSRDGDHFAASCSSTRTFARNATQCRSATRSARRIFTFRWSRIAKAAQENWQRSFIIVLGCSVAVFLLAGVLFSRLVSRPVDKLVKATAEISAGNLDHGACCAGGALQQQSQRKPFIAVNCSAIPENLLEANCSGTRRVHLRAQ